MDCGYLLVATKTTNDPVYQALQWLFLFVEEGTSSCASTPLSKIVSLPAGCHVGTNESVDVRTCNHDPCRIHSEESGDDECSETPASCCAATETKVESLGALLAILPRYLCTDNVIRVQSSRLTDGE